MEQVCSVPFSALVATLLLNNRVVTAKEIVNFSSMISFGDGNTIIDIIDDDIDYLSICVDVDEKFNFSIKPSLNYDSIIDGGLTVRQFLIKNSLSNDIRKLISKNVDCNFDFYSDLEFHNQNSNDSNVLSKRKIRFPLIYKGA